MPENVQDELFTSYLYVHFLKRFNHCIYKSMGEHKLSRWVWTNVPYRNFIFNMLNRLEPYMYRKNEIIFEELDEIREVVFIMGQYHVGYSINKKSMFRLKQSNLDIGAFGITFNKRSHYIFKSAANVNGYFVRKLHWVTLLNDDI